MTIYLMESIDFDGARWGRTWTSKAYRTKEKAIEAAMKHMEHKGWPDQVWQPYAKFPDEKYCRMPFEWERWSNNRYARRC